jgi:hypothetical protein
MNLGVTILVIRIIKLFSHFCPGKNSSVGLKPGLEAVSIAPGLSPG